MNLFKDLTLIQIFKEKVTHSYTNQPDFGLRYCGVNMSEHMFQNYHLKSFKLNSY